MRPAAHRGRTHMLERSRTPILRSLLLSGLGALVACSSPGSTGTSGAGSSPSPEAVALPAAVAPSWATTANFHGRVEAASPVSLQVHLRMHNEADAKAELEM